ncbi:MAG: lipopolysaccharide biosynthesis protein RfbH [Euryarchaeota archaeon]|nr:lipopolysaccharide biosynthesis protein RfbH [Euryarchaeota archaeon]MBU4038107.1 lipopolysaccharide biosynthesis protein RfbH [Pseudomonadota bacterium]
MSKKTIPPEQNPGREKGEVELRSQILKLVADYALAYHGNKQFIPGVSPVPVSGKVFDTTDVQSLVSSSLDFWLTTGRFNLEFEKQLSSFLKSKYLLTTNSGSSANLLAVSALTSPLLGERAMVPGDEVITVAAGFPTTVNPILQNGFLPVFCDVDIPTYNIRNDQIEKAISNKTRAIMLAHTLGNPFDLDEVLRIAKEHSLWVIEDCCDALGSKYNGKRVGAFGDIATFSFYPAHHITMGEGGAVATNDPKLKKIIQSFRDWGRDCHCEPGQDNTCGNRYGHKFGDLPQGYDHKYVYSHVGYNLKITDMQAAVGVAQLGHLPDFIKARKQNFNLLSKKLKSMEDCLILPEATPNSDPSWFGFPITLHDDVPFSRTDLLKQLELDKIGMRLLFGSNLIRQPYFNGKSHLVSGQLENTEIITNNTFWVGVYPGLTSEMISYIASSIENFVRRKR